MASFVGPGQKAPVYTAEMRRELEMDGRVRWWFSPIPKQHRRGQRKETMSRDDRWKMMAASMARRGITGDYAQLRLINGRPSQPLRLTCRVCARTMKRPRREYIAAAEHAVARGLEDAFV